MINAEKNFIDKIQCRVLEKYLVLAEKERSCSSCWKLAEKICDFRFDYNVCQDCIVHVYATDNDESSKQQLENILHKRFSTQ